MALTAFGPVMLWTQRYTIDVGLQGGNLFGQMWTDPGTWPTTYRQLIGTDVVERRYMPWNGYLGGYGWPAWPSREGGAWNATHPGFIGPRRVRSHNAKTGGTTHPNILDPIYGADGGDFRLDPKPRDVSAIRLLFTPELESPSGGQMGVWQAQDKLFEYEAVTDLDTEYTALRASMQTDPSSSYMPRVKLFREHYNTMAAWINSLKKCRPYCWTDFTHYLEATEETVIGKGGVALVWDNDISDGLSPGGGTRGILGTTIRPINQYCSFEEDSALYRLFDALGVTIKTEANLPSGLLDAFTTSAIFKRPKGTVSAMIDSVTNIGTDHWRYKTHEELADLDYTEDLEGAAIISEGTVNNAFGTVAPSYPLDGDGFIELVDYFWVTVSDVKAAAEALGFLFIWEELSIPLTLESFDIADTITPLVTTTAYSYFEEFSVDPREVGFSSSFDFGHNPTEQLIHPVDDIQTEQMMFVQTATLPSWKRDWPAVVARRVTDVTPADVGLYRLLAQGFVLQVSVPDACRKELRFLRQAQYEYKTTLLYQILASSAYTNQSAALKIPSPYAAHADDDFSLVSEDNARAAMQFRPDIYAFEMVGEYGPASVQGFTQGNNFVVAAAGMSHEVYIWQDAYVNLDLERITEESILRATEEGVTREIE